MSGNNHALSVYLGDHKLAKLTFSNERLEWLYTKKWQEIGYPISPHLPLHEQIPSVNVERFLRNLLPEGNGLDELIRCFHLSRYNTFGLVQALGLDIPGALVIISSEKKISREPFFRPISDNELEQRLKSREELSLIIWDSKPRLSSAGVQDKINVMLNSEGQLGFGEGSLCSTHLLKFEKKNVAHLVLNEYITMQLARNCGLTVAKVKLMRYGKEPALLVERFDRKLVSNSLIKRRHIIDGCQSLNLSPDHKSERNFGGGRDVAHIRDGASLIKLFAFADQCANPAITKLQLLDWTLFNVLIFNYDAHGKNISFFVGSNGIVLTPFYDLVNIRMYQTFEQEMAMALGDEFDGNTVNAYQLADFADTCQLNRTLVATRLRTLIAKLVDALNDDLFLMATTNEEQQYLQRYRSMILERCDHLLIQSEGILTIVL